MKKIAVCGNIASGKSTVQNFLEKQGFKVLDTDEVAHKLLTVANVDLYNTFKEYDVFENGEFLRLKVGKLVFSDKDAKLKLEAILHPQIKKEIEKFFDINSSEKLLFVGIPLLFEANMQDMFDKIIFVYADDDIRLKRLIERNGYSVDYAKQRINSQLSQDEKINFSDYIIRNNGSMSELEKSLTKVVEKL